MWERRSINLPSLAWMDKAEASLFRCDGLDSALQERLFLPAPLLNSLALGTESTALL
jgi:hypothetical protein